MNVRLSFKFSSTFSSFYEAQGQVQGQYKLDETLDQINVSFNSTSLSTLVAPFTKVKVLFEGEAFLDVANKPSNYDEMVVVKGDMVYNGNGSFTHNYLLVEPLHVLKFIRMETLTFTNSERAIVSNLVGGSWVDYEYSKEPYNLYTVLKRILQVTRTKSTDENLSLWRWNDGTDTVDNKIRIMDEALLNETLLNNDDNYTENTIYDALIKIGLIIGRTPVLYFSRNSLFEWDLYFERKDGISGNQYQFSSLIPNSQGYVLSNTPENNATTVVSDAVNMVGLIPSISVSTEWTTLPSYADGFVGSRNSIETEIFIVLQNKISSVNRLRWLTADYDPSVELYQAVGGSIECLEKRKWEVDGDRELKAYYIEGENKIYFGNTLRNSINKANSVSFLGGDLGDRPPFPNNIDWVNFSVTYYALFEGKIQFRKSETLGYETTFNQPDSYIDSGNYGLMLQDYINRQANVDLTITIKHNTYASMMKLNDVFILNNENYIVTVIDFKTIGTGIIATYQANKSFTQRHYNVRASQRKRDYLVSYDNTKNRFTNFYVPVKVGFGVLRFAINSSSMKYINFSKLKLAFTSLLTQAKRTALDNEYIQIAGIHTYSTANRVSPTVATETFDKYFVLPITSTISGNSVLFNIRFTDNTQTPKHVYKTEFLTGIWNDPVNQGLETYTNPFNEVEVIDLVLSPYNEVKLVTQPFSNYATKTSVDNYRRFLYTYPISTLAKFNEMSTNEVISVLDYKYLKDSSEIPNFVIQIDFRPETNKTIIHQELIKFSGFLVSGSARNTLLPENVSSPTNYYLVVLDKNIGANEIITNAEVIGSSGVVLTIPRNNLNLDNNDIRITLPSTINVNNKSISLCLYDSVKAIYRPLITQNGFTATNVSQLFIYV